MDGFGAGILHRFPISRKDGRVDINQKKVGEWNDESIYALDQETGNLVRLTGKDALALFPEEFSSKIDYAAPSVQMHMANVGLFLEHRLGFPVDLEFATDQELSESLLQIRPISKRPRVAQPNVHPYDLLLSSGDVIGYGKVNFDYILYVKCPDGAPSDLSDIIAALSQKYPRSLVIYSTRVVQMATERAIEEDLFPHVQAVICNDIDYTAHSHHASTMSHMALNLANEHKIFMSTSGGNANRLLKMLKTQGILDERFRPTGLNGEYRSLVEVKVYHFNVDVQMAADDDFGWGMLYLVDDYS